MVPGVVPDPPPARRAQLSAQFRLLIQAEISGVVQTRSPMLSRRTTSTFIVWASEHSILPALHDRRIRKRMDRRSNIVSVYRYHAGHLVMARTPSTRTTSHLLLNDN